MHLHIAVLDARGTVTIEARGAPSRVATRRAPMVVPAKGAKVGADVGAGYLASITNKL